MAVTENLHTGNGSKTNYSFTFPYLKTTDIKVSVNGSVVTNFTAGSPTATEIQFNTAPANNDAIRIYRDTATENLSATFYAGSAIKSEDLNDNFLQNLYVTQEAKRDADAAWQDGDETISSSETWHTSDDTKVATTKAIENRIDTKIDTALTTDVVGGQSVTVTDNSPSTGKITVAVTDASIGTTQLAADAVTGAKIADDQINSEHYVAGSIDTEHIGNGQVTHDKLGADCIDGDNIQDDVINSEHYAAGSIDEEHIATGAVTHDKLGADCIDGDNIQNDVINSEHYAAGSIDTEHIANDQVTADKLANTSVTAGSYTATDLTVDAQGRITAAASGTIGTSEIANDAVTTDKINNNAVTTAKIADAELKTLAGMPSDTASRLADSTALTSTTAELNILDNKTFRTSGDGTLTTTSDTEMPSSKVIATHVASSITAVGGFKSIADEVSFPATASMPATGVAVSINNAAGVVVNGSGVSTTGRTVDGTPATVTINGFPSSLYGETLAAGVGLIVQATSTANTYTYHKLLAAETDVKQLSDDINDFNARYRVAGSAPGSNNDAGDLYFDTAANKMKVYNATTSQWDDVASVGNFYINTLSSTGSGSDTIPGGSATFNGTAKKFALSNAPTMAQQLIVSINGVIQKPNAGSSVPSEGFAIDGNNIIFSAAPAAGSDYFIITQGSSVSIGTPSDNTVATAKIQNLAVTNDKIANDTIAEGKLDVHNAPATGKYLKYTSNGMEWSDGASEGTDVKSTGESGGIKYLREDGDGTCSWQPVGGFLPSGGGSINGDLTLLGTNYDIVWHKSTFNNSGDPQADTLNVRDNAKVSFGAGYDLRIYHDATDNQIKSANGKIVVSTTANNDDIEITPHGSGNVKLDGLSWPTADGSSGQYLKTNGSGSLSWSDVNANGIGNHFTAVADGAIAANKPVYISTSTGKVKQAAETTVNLATPGAGNSNSYGNTDTRQEGFISIGGNYFWLGFMNGSSGDDLYAKLGTYNTSSDTLTMSGSTLVSGTTGSSAFISPVYDTTAERFMVVWQYGTGHSKNLSYIVGSRSGTTLSYGTQAEFQSTTGSNDHEHGPSLAGAFDSDNQGCCWIWQRSTVNKTLCRPAQISTSANSASLGSTTELLSGQNGMHGCDIVFDSNVNRYLAAYAFKSGGNEYKITFRVGNPSSATSISWGTEYTINNGSTNIRGPKLEFDPDSNLVLCIVNDITNDKLKQIPLRITGGSTNTVALADSNGATTIENYGSGMYAIKYDTSMDKMVMYYRDKNNSDRPTAMFGTYSENYSGTDDYYTWSSITQLHTTGVENYSGDYSKVSDGATHPLAVLPAGGRAFAYFRSGSGGQRATVIKGTNTTHNIDNHHYVGFPDAAYSDGQTVTVKTEGNVVSGLSGLTPFSVVYGDTQNNIGHASSGDALAYNSLGKAISTDKLHINVAYQ